MRMFHPPPGSQNDLFGPQQPPLWQTTNARWIIEEGDHKGQRCILKSSFDSERGDRFGRVIIEDTREEIVLPVTDFRLLMDTVVPPGVEPFRVRRPRTAIADTPAYQPIQPVEARSLHAA